MMCMSMKKGLYSSSSVVSSRTWNRFINCPPPIPPTSTSASTADDLPDVWHKSTVLPHSQHDCIQPSNKQTAALIDGKSIANDIKAGIALEIRKMKDSIGKIPGLGVVLVGKRKDSSSFIRIKKKACDEVGIASLIRQLPEDCSEAEVLEAVSSFNLNPSIHGIIVQLPLPRHLDEEKVMNTVCVEKDVDGFHPLNLGCLAMRGREPLFIPCAPKGCIELLLRSGMEIKGKTAVVIGRGKLVGLPTSLLLQRHHATVCTVNAFTKNPEQITCGADIVVSDVGVPNLIRGHWLKPGAFVIDTGANLVKDPNRSSGYRVTGDVCFEEAVRKASAITPVPGGVGPVAISMLLSNTLDSAKLAYSNRCI